MLLAAGTLAAPALIGRVQAAPLRMRLSSSLPSEPKYANGRTFSDRQLLACLLVIVFVPALALWLPHAMGY